MEHINEIYKEVIREARALNLPISNKINEEIVINRRAKSRFGCCKRIKRLSGETFEIEISHRLLNCDQKMIKQTLAHELLHTCACCDNHGHLWQAYARKMNEAYGYNIKRTGTAEQLGIEENEQKRILKENYVLICKNCGIKVARTRMSNVVKYPSQYRCRCGGKLERIK